MTRVTLVHPTRPSRTVTVSVEKARRYRNAGWTDPAAPEPEPAPPVRLTIPAVLDRVDEDPIRAQAALAAELSSPRPRVTLVNQLEQIAFSGHDTPFGEEE